MRKLFFLSALLIVCGTGWTEPSEATKLRDKFLPATAVYEEAASVKRTDRSAARKQRSAGPKRQLVFQVFTLSENFETAKLALEAKKVKFREQKRPESASGLNPDYRRAHGEAGGWDVILENRRLDPETKTPINATTVTFVRD